MNGTPVAILLIAAMMALACGAALSAVEAALTRMTRAAAEDLVEEGRRGAPRVAALAHRRSEVLASVAATRVAVDMLAAVFTTLAVSGLVDRWWLVALIAVGVNAVLLGSVVGISPRSAGRRNPAGVLLAMVGIVEKVDAIGRPWRWLERRYGHSSTLTDAEARAEVTEDLREMIDEIGEAETIEDEDRQMLRSVVELGQTLVREVMVPRTDMVTINADKPISAAMRLFVLSGFSRVPVIGDDADDIRGVVYLKDLLRRLDTQPEYASRPVSTCVREAVYVPESKRADDLLREMQTDHVHMALAVDEYGGIAGLVTMEDVLEEVVGEMRDEHDHALPEVELLSPEQWKTELAALQGPRDKGILETMPTTGPVYRVPARLSLDELGELFDIEIDDDDVDTAGGLLTKAIGRVPLPGAYGDIQGLHLAAQELAGRRRQVTSLLVWRLDSGESDQTH